MEETKTEWQTMANAPKHEAIEVHYGKDENEIIDLSVAIWSDQPVCMLGSRNGCFNQGWATAAGYGVDSNLPIDTPNFWRPI